MGNGQSKLSLHDHAARGNVSEVQQVLSKQPDLLDVPDTFGFTPIKAIDTPNNNGWTPLYAAASNGHVSVIETLVGLGSNAIDIPDHEGWTPLYVAAFRGNASLIETLVRLGSKAIDTPDKSRRTPLSAAAENGHSSAIETLFRLGSKAIDTPDNVGDTPLKLAAETGQKSVIELLVRLGSNAIDTPNNNSYTPMHAAADRGHVSAIETLGRLGSQAIDTPNNDGWTPMHLAAQRGRQSAIETLVRLGSNAASMCNAEGHTPFAVADQNGHEEAIEVLIRLRYPEAPLHSAAANGDLEVVELLHRLGKCPINTQNQQGQTALYAAASKGHVPVIEALTRLGSGLDVSDNEGRTPLRTAALNGHVSVIETLIRLGSKAIDTPDNYGSTPMHAAASNKHASVIEALVRLGSKAIDTPDNNGISALVFALRAGNVAVIEALVRLGSRALETFGEDFLSPAIERRNTNVIPLLVEAGADISLINPNLSGQLEILNAGMKIPAISFLKYFNSTNNKKALVLNGANLTNELASSIPFQNWRSCSTVDFRNNPLLTEIPASLAKLDPELTTSIIFDPTTRKWSNYEAQVINSGDPRAIIDLARLKEEGSAPIPSNERKLMAVGYAAVGKTTVIRRLRNENYTHPVSTDGVDMGELILQTGNNEPMRVVVWDFAGQPLYRQTHLLFLRNPGLCLLLFKLTDNANKSVEQLRYWCDTLKSFGASGTQVLLVGTHLDRCADRSRAQQYADNVHQQLQQIIRISEPPLLVSCADGAENEQTIIGLRAAILRAALRMDLKVPACLEIVRKALLPTTGIDVPLMSSKAAHDIIRHHATRVKHNRLASDPRLRETCLRALQVLGSVLVVEERRQMTHVVTNPQWVALLLATVVTTRHSWVARGRVSFATLSSQIWRGDRRFPAETHLTLVAILQQLKLMFAVDNRRGNPTQEFFIPSSLPEHRSDPRFRVLSSLDDSSNKSPDRLHRVFKVNREDQVVPNRAVPEIMLHLLPQPRVSFLEMWQQGGVFQVCNEAETVEASVCRSSSDTIEVVVMAQQPVLRMEWMRDMSTMVENQLTEVHNVEFEVLIPCNNADDLCFVSLNDVRRCVLNRSLRVSCRRSQHAFRIDALAPDVVFADLGSQTFLHEWSSVELIRQLGQGSFGRVMLGRLVASSPSSSVSSSDEVAVKLLEKKGVANNPIANYREFQHEAYLMSILSHPNIVRFVGVCLPSQQASAEHEGAPGLLMEVVGGGTLYQLVTDSVGISQICQLAVKTTQEVDRLNIAQVQHRALPEPLLPLIELCDGAMGRTNRIFDDRIFPLARQLGHNDAPQIRRLQELHQQLNHQLGAYYKGPVTQELADQVNQVIDDINALKSQTNRLLMPIEWPLRLKLATDVAQGLVQMHSLNPPLVHRDLKSPNVFLTRRLDGVELASIDWSRPLAKVGDFGLSVRLLGTSELKDGQSVANINPTWAAPEVLSKQGHSTEADVYAMGITMWELFSREHPFSNVPEHQISKYVLSGGRPVVPGEWRDNNDDVMGEYLALMERCWDPEPERRPLMTEVFASLRDMCRRTAPEVFVTLPDLTFRISIEPNTRCKTNTRREYEIDSVERLALSGEIINPAAKVMSLQWIDDGSFWAGLNDGSVIALQLNNSNPEDREISCTTNDRHQQSVTAMCFSAAQQMTVWSGSEDGRIFVWSATVEKSENARSRCYLKCRFVVVETTIQNLKGKALYCVVRNGWLYMYPDDHVGPPCHEFDLCVPGLIANTQTSTGYLELIFSSFRLVLQPINTSGDETANNPMPNWQRIISYLAVSGRGLSRLAASPHRHSREFITALEATDDATWCLTLTALVEWHLIDMQHGLHNQMRLEPGRQLAFDMGCEQFCEPRLRVVCGLAWVAPSILWMGAANTIGCVDLSASSSSSMSFAPPPIRLACSECHQQHDGSCGQHFLLLNSSASPSAILSLDSPSILQSSSSTLSRECVSCNQNCSLLFGIVPWAFDCAGCQATLCGDCQAKNWLCGRCTFEPRQIASTSTQQQRSDLVLQWPSTDTIKHEDAVRLITLVESRASISGLEVWTYSSSGEIFVWQTPIRTSSEGAVQEIGPVFLARVEVRRDAPQLTCMEQVGNQVWAGTRQGTIIGWDIETRAPLSDHVMPVGLQHIDRTSRARPTSDIASGRKNNSMMTVLSCGQESTLRRFDLVSRRDDGP